MFRYVVFATLAAVAQAVLQVAGTTNCSATVNQPGKSIVCPCTNKCIDGTTAGQPGQCQHYYDFFQVCGELKTEPSCSKTQGLILFNGEDKDDYGHPAPGLGWCIPKGSSSCGQSISNYWHIQNIGWQCCQCPSGFIAGTPGCPGANPPSLPHRGDCWRCTEPGEQLVQDLSVGYGYYKCISSCVPSTSTCDFYNTLEKNHRCGSSGYALKYGYRNCQKYSAAASNFSSAGQVWINKVRGCLQQALVSDCQSPGGSCATIRTDAFASHAPCYINSGFCDLSVNDKIKVLEVVGFDLVWPLEVISQAAQVEAHCVDVFFEKWTKKLEKGVSDKLKNAVCSTIPSWC